jgi:hypothetical protein
LRSTGHGGSNVTILRDEIIEKLHAVPLLSMGAGYRYRLKVECLFSSVKERYNAFVRSENGAGPANEIALNFLAHNIHVIWSRRTAATRQCG